MIQKWKVMILLCQNPQQTTNFTQLPSFDWSLHFEICIHSFPFLIPIHNLCSISGYFASHIVVSQNIALSLHLRVYALQMIHLVWWSALYLLLILARSPKIYSIMIVAEDLNYIWDRLAPQLYTVVGCLCLKTHSTRVFRADKKRCKDMK